MPSDLEHSGELVAICRRRAAAAYDAWLRMKGRAERQGEQSPETHSDQQFINAIRKLVRLSGREIPSKLGVPTTRSGWANWRKDRGSTTPRISLKVCQSILILTDIDITHDSVLGHKPINATDFVRLGHVHLKSNPSKSEQACIKLKNLEFRIGGTRDVVLDDIGERYRRTRSNTLIGDVRLALRQAFLVLIDESNLQLGLHHILNESAFDVELLPGSDIQIDYPIGAEGLIWRIQPIFPKIILQSALSNVELCRCVYRDDECEAFIYIAVFDRDIEVILNLVPGAIKNEKYMETKRKIVQKFLRDRILHDFGDACHAISKSRVLTCQN